MELPPPATPAALLRRVPLFQNLESEGVEDLLRHCRRRVFRARTRLFEEGDPGHTLFVIVRGGVVIQKSGPDSGEPIFVAERRSGECIGEMALFDDAPRSASAVALPDTEVLVLNRDDFLRCVRRHPEVALAVIRTLSARLRAAAEKTTRDAGLDVMGRLAAYLLEASHLPEVNAVAGPAQNSVPLTVTARRKLAPRPSDREIGERIGATRESVSRKLTQLVRLRIIERAPGAITLLDEKRLRALCGQSG